MTVSLRPHPNASGFPATDAQIATAHRWAKRHPKLKGKLTCRGRHTGFASILVDGHDSDCQVTIDRDGYVVAWFGGQGDWRRIGHPIDPPDREDSQDGI